MSRTLAVLMTTLALFAVGCVQTRVHEFHRDPAFDGERYEKMIVHCSVEGADRRQLMENIVADRLRDAGYDAIASHHVEARSKSQKKNFQLGDYPGYDALVWIGWGEYEETIARTPGYVEHYVTLGYGGGFGHRRQGYRRRGGHFGGGFGTVFHAPTERRRWWLRTRIELIDAATEKKVWSGKADTTSRHGDLPDLAEDLAGEIVSILRERPAQIRHG
ncbi:MAG: hypothetical protein V3W41_18230 [Planctomycetota bacterium]